MELSTDVTALVEALAAQPSRAALLLDFDGTFAPIVPRPADARLMDGAAHAIATLVERFALVGFVSGRARADVAERVKVPGLAYAGNHGMELQLPGQEPQIAAQVVPWRDTLEAFIAGHRADPHAVAGVEVEDKGATLSVHWRNAVDIDLAERWLRGPRRQAAEAHGLRVTWGRMVMEVRPPITLDKGTASRALVEHCGADIAVHIGDDHTDADAWRALHAMKSEGVLVIGAGVLASGPGIDDSLRQIADAEVPGPEGALAMLRAIVAATDRATE